ncbi:hypothetical protein [Magnetococcus sp. PR-3]
MPYDYIAPKFGHEALSLQDVSITDVKGGFLDPDGVVACRAVQKIDGLV